MPNPLPIVDCQQCGACCLHMGYPSFNLPLEEILEDRVAPASGGKEGSERETVSDRDRDRWQQLPTELRESLVAAIRAYQSPASGLDGPCLWLDPETRLCRHHTYRPQVCRDFEVGGDGCRAWRSAKGIASA